MQFTHAGRGVSSLRARGPARPAPRARPRRVEGAWACRAASMSGESAQRPVLGAVTGRARRGLPLEPLRFGVGCTHGGGAACARAAPRGALGRRIVQGGM